MNLFLAEFVRLWYVNHVHQKNSPQLIFLCESKMSCCKTEFTGVYARQGSGKKRVRPDGSMDQCFFIRYWVSKKWQFETAGWESEGMTAAKAASLREERLAALVTELPVEGLPH